MNTTSDGGNQRRGDFRGAPGADRTPTAGTRDPSSARADPPSPTPVEALRASLKERRKGGCEYAPCPTYRTKNPADYGYGSCAQCGWSEPEHVIDQLLAALTTLQAQAEQAEQKAQDRERQIDVLRDMHKANAIEIQAITADLQSLRRGMQALETEMRLLVQNVDYTSAKHGGEKNIAADYAKQWADRLAVLLRGGGVITEDKKDQDLAR